MSRVLEKLKNLNPKETGSLNVAPKSVSVATSSRPWKILVAGVLLVLGFSYNVHKYMPKPDIFAPQAALTDPMKRLQAGNRDALMLFRQSNFAQAKESFQKLVLEFPKEADLFVNLAMTYKKLGEWEKAEDALKTALNLKADHAIAMNNLAMLYVQNNRLTEASEVLRKAADDSGKHPEFIYNLGLVYEKDQQLGLSIEYYKRYISHPKADQNLARRLEKRLPRLNSLYTYQKRKGEG